MPKLTFRFVISNEWKDKEFEVAKAVMSDPSLLDCGWGNGYVAVHRNHPDFGKDYNLIDVDVHYGLTYGAPLASMAMRHLKIIMDAFGSDEILDENDYWVFGFDTSHFQDNKLSWPKERVEIETKHLQLQFIERQKSLPVHEDS